MLSCLCWTLQRTSDLQIADMVPTSPTHVSKCFWPRHWTLQCSWLFQVDASVWHHCLNGTVKCFESSKQVYKPFTMLFTSTLYFADACLEHSFICAFFPETSSPKSIKQFKMGTCLCSRHPFIGAFGPRQRSSALFVIWKGSKLWSACKQEIWSTCKWTLFGNLWQLVPPQHPTA